PRCLNTQHSSARIGIRPRPHSDDAPRILVVAGTGHPQQTRGVSPGPLAHIDHGFHASAPARSRRHYGRRVSLLLSPLSIRSVTFPNRLWVSPMCMYSAIDGVVQEWHHTHLTQFASGGAGLVVAEATSVVPEGRISPRDTGIWNDEQRDAWAPIVKAIHDRGGLAGIQLAHAGRKASTWWPWAEQHGS